MLLWGSLALTGCVTPDDGSNGSYVPPGITPTVLPSTPLATVTGGAGSTTRVGLLVPLTGANADKGADLLKAAQLALAGPDAPTLDVKDTGSTPQGAAEAARQAIALGDSLLLGPLTSGETASVAPVAESLKVPVLAFTSDRSQAQPGVWVLGLTPTQQVQRLVQAAQQAGKTRIAAVLPDNDLGHAMGDALTKAAAADGLPVPQQRSYQDGMASVTEAVRDLSDYADRRGPIDAQIHAARTSDDPAARKAAALAANQPLPPVPFDAVLLGDVGTPLAELATLLPYYDVTGVQIMGPALWALPQNRAGAGAIMGGAWFAAPDPSARADFVQAFTTKFGEPPSVLADLGFDAGAIARVTAQGGGATLLESLTRPGGFTGANGVLRLQPDGRVQRALAVFELSNGTPSVISPAPSVLITPPSS